MMTINPILDLTIEKIIERFKNLMASKYVPECGDVETTINTGYCYCLAYILGVKGHTLDNETTVVRSYNHWFFRIREHGQYVYYDCRFPEGTEELMDITDNTPNGLEVWSLSDLLVYLDSIKIVKVYDDFLKF